MYDNYVTREELAARDKETANAVWGVGIVLVCVLAPAAVTTGLWWLAGIGLVWLVGAVMVWVIKELCREIAAAPAAIAAVFAIYRGFTWREWLRELKGFPPLIVLVGSMLGGAVVIRVFPDAPYLWPVGLVIVPFSLAYATTRFVERLLKESK